MKHGKRYRTAAELMGEKPLYGLEEALALVKKTGTAKFDETVELAARLGVDPRHSEQQVRGTVVLPFGTGKSKRVLVLTKGEKAKEAVDAGADYVGFEEYVEKLKGGWLEVDAIVATPDVMSEVGKLGRILGPKGLMPNPKSGTVTFDITKAIREIKAGKIEYRVDKGGIVHVPVGKVSFDVAKLSENTLAFLRELARARPASSKGQFVRSLTLSSTMGPGVRLDWAAIQALLK